MFDEEKFIELMQEMVYATDRIQLNWNSRMAAWMQVTQEDGSEEWERFPVVASSGLNYQEKPKIHVLMNNGEVETFETSTLDEVRIEIITDAGDWARLCAEYSFRPNKEK